jgi:VanZ family protein
MAAMFGLSDEIHQYFVPGRNMDPLDLLTDAIGAALALWVAGWIVRRRAGASPANERGTADLT